MYYITTMKIRDFLKIMFFSKKIGVLYFNHLTRLSKINVIFGFQEAICRNYIRNPQEQKIFFQTQPCVIYVLLVEIVYHQLLKTFGAVSSFYNHMPIHTFQRLIVLLLLYIYNCNYEIDYSLKITLLSFYSGYILTFNYLAIFIHYLTFII